VLDGRNGHISVLDSREIDEYLTARGVSLHSRAETWSGLDFFGLSAMPLWGGTTYEFSEEEIETFLEPAVAPTDRPLIVLSHPPPRGVVDLTRSGQHVGSTALRRWALEASPHAIVCGHIHEARGVERLGDTVVVNCGQARSGYYAVVEIDAENPDRVSVDLREVS